MKVRYILTLPLLFLLVIFGKEGGGVDFQNERMNDNSENKAKTVLFHDQNASESKEQEENSAQYRYDPTGKPDPFKPFVAPESIVKGPGSAPLSPLQKFDISQLNLVGIIWGIEDSRAILEDSVGKGYIVAKGTYVGRRGGKVSKIEKNRIIVTRKYKDYLDNVQTKDIEIKLRKLEGGKK